MKKYYLIIFFIIFIFLNIHSEEIKTEETEKIFEFNIGGGIGQFGFITLVNIEDKIYYRIENDDFGEDDEECKKTIKSTIIDYDLTGHGINWFLTSSFAYYINNNFGLGISSSLGFGLLFSRGVISFRIFDVFANMRFVNKIGNYYKRKFFYLEYGFDLLGEIVIEHTSTSMHDEEFDYFESEYFLYLGPGLLIGYNQIIQNNFSIVVGLNFSILFCYRELHGEDNSLFPREGSEYTFLYDSDTDIENYDIFREVLNTTFRVGIETRFMFNFSKKKNK